MTPLYSYWHSLYMSLYSRAFYLDVGRGQQGAGFGYVAVVSAFCAALLVGYWTFTISKIDLVPHIPALPGEQEPKKDLNEVLIRIIAQVPTIIIKEGKASITEDQPYTIYYPDGEYTPFALIDTRETPISLDETKAVILLTQNRLIYRTSPDAVQSYDIATLSKGDRVITSDTLTTWIREGRKTLLWIMPLLVFPMLSVFGFIYMAVRSLIFGLLGMVIGNVLKVEGLEYIDYVRLAAAASMPVALAYMLIFFYPPLGALIPLNAVIFAIGLGYVYVAVKANR